MRTVRIHQFVGHRDSPLLGGCKTIDNLRMTVVARSFTLICSHRDHESMDAMDPKQE